MRSSCTGFHGACDHTLVPLDLLVRVNNTDRAVGATVNERLWLRQPLIFGRGGKRRPWSRRRLTFWSRWDGVEPLKLVPIFALRVIGICGRERRCVLEGEERKIIYSSRWGEKMMMVGGSGAAVDHNGIYPNPNLHSLQQPLMEADNADSRKRPLETPEEEAGCTKRTNIGGKTQVQICLWWSRVWGNGSRTRWVPWTHPSCELMQAGPGSQHVHAWSR